MGPVSTFPPPGYGGNHGRTERVVWTEESHGRGGGVGSWAEGNTGVEVRKGRVCVWDGGPRGGGVGV